MPENRPVFASALLVLCLSTAGPLAAGTIKKWVDENGVVHYGTSIPPQYVQQGHVELNDQGIEVKRVDRAPTPEEIAREREREALRRAQQKIIEEQRARDRVLLNMYQSEDDLLLMKNGKIAQIDAQIQLKKARIQQLKRQLSKWQARAAERERKGLRPTEQQLEHLATLQRQLETTYAGIVEREADKKRLAERYDRELARFRLLKRGFRAASAQDVEPQRRNERVIPVDGAFVCHDTALCDRLWPHAKAWAKRHADTPVEVIGERLLVTRAPNRADQVSLTVSRLERQGVERLFLDVSCMHTVSGRQHCESEPVRALPGRFVTDMRAIAERIAAGETVSVEE